MAEPEIPFKLTPFPEHDLVWIRHDGDVLRDELRQVYTLLHGETADTRYGTVFTDLAHVTSVEFGFSELHYHAQRLQDQLRHLGRRQRDCFHAPGSMVFGMARIYQQVIDPDGPLQVHVNERRENALQALDLSTLPEALL